MCNIHGLFKGLWDIKPSWFIDCPVKSIWVWNRRSEIHESYLTNRKQRVRVNKTFSEWERITTGVPQDSISGPLLFDIFLNDLFLFVSNASLSNYADGNTLYTFGDNLKKIKDNLRNSFDVVINRFTKIMWCLMQENVISCFSGITQKRTILIS